VPVNFQEMFHRSIPRCQFSQTYSRISQQSTDQFV